ncbi:riboflavin kinase [Xanthoria parietina]
MPTHRPTRPRSPLAGPSAGPTSPFPIPLSGPIVKGFGRGSRDLGIPTANIPLAGLSVGGHQEVESGVYYGWAGVDVDAHGLRVTEGGNEGGGGAGGVWPMVMSIGWNPFYKNTVRSVEVHIMHGFANDFYGARMNLLILGFVRPEYDYVDKESLVEDIRTDIEVARRSLEREAYARLKDDPYLIQFQGGEHEQQVAS